jgi:hypothetical protein
MADVAPVVTQAPVVPTPAATPVVEVKVPTDIKPEIKADPAKIEVGKVEEAPKEAPKEEPKDDMAKKFAHIAREEKRIRQERDHLKKEREKVDFYEKTKAEAKKNPLKYLEGAGLTYQELVDYILNDQKPTEKMLQSDELGKIKNDLEALKKEKEESVKALQARELEENYNLAINGIKTELGASEKYDLLKSFGGPEVVYNVMLEHYNRTRESGKPKVLQFDEAAEAADKYFEGEIKSTLKTLKEKAPKRFEDFIKDLVGSKEEHEKPQESIKSPAVTLSNSLQAEGMKPSAQSSRLKSKDESIAEIARQYKIFK